MFNKQELMENYTKEQLADMVVNLLEKKLTDIEGMEFYYMGEKISKKSYEDIKDIQNYKEWHAKLGEPLKIILLNNRIETLESELRRKEREINQIENILEKLFGVTHDVASKPDDFEKILTEKAEEYKTIVDFLPTEPIKVADMLINAEGEYEHNSIAKAFCGTDKGTYKLFDISKLRQIAEHLLIYCNANGSEGEE